MTDTTVKIKSKSGCSKTGITDTLATRLHAQGPGHRFVAIVEFKVDERGEKDAGNDKVFLSVEEIEPVIAEDGDIERAIDEQVRTMWNALAQNRMRATHGDQLPLEGDKVGPSLKDTIQQGEALIERNDLGEPIGIFSGKKKAGAPS